MFSKDSNIETIAQLVEEVKKYVSLQSEYLRLSAVEKFVRLLTALAIALVLVVLFLLALIYVSFAAAFALGTVVGNAQGFLIVGGVYLALLVLFMVFHKAWIERPLVKFLASMLTD